MAGFTTIAAIGKSVEDTLSQAFLEQPPVTGRTTRAALIRVEDLARAESVSPDCSLSIVLYSVELNKVARVSRPGTVDGAGQPAFDLRYLLLPSADSAEQQHMILGSTLTVLDRSPVLTGVEGVRLVLEQPAAETTQRIQLLPGGYRLSVSCVARVRIDSRQDVTRRR